MHEVFAYISKDEVISAITGKKNPAPEPDAAKMWRGVPPCMTDNHSFQPMLDGRQIPQKIEEGQIDSLAKRG